MSEPTAPLAHRIVGTGPPLLLVAGTGFPGASWHLPELIGPLAERHTVITFDHRGTGETPGTGGPYSTRLLAADAIALVHRLGREQVDVLGHSMGGRVAQWMLLDAPEVVRSVVLAATGPGQFRADQEVTRGVPVKTALGIGEHGYEEHMRRHIGATFFTPEFAAEQPERVEWLVRAYWDHRPSLEDYLKHVVARQQHQTADRLHEISRPTLILVGDRDTHLGGTGSHWEQSRYLAEHVPGATFESIPGCSHGYFWQAPERTVDAIERWLAARPVLSPA